MYFQPAFRRERLPSPSRYYSDQGLRLLGGGEWRSALCPFHQDSRPSLRVCVNTGGFRCMSCGAHGGDVVAFHMKRHQMGFIEAAWQLGAWEGGR
jgi:hypothetical protein